MTYLGSSLLALSFPFYTHCSCSTNNIIIFSYDFTLKHPWSIAGFPFISILYNSWGYEHLKTWCIVDNTPFIECIHSRIHCGRSINDEEFHHYDLYCKTLISPLSIYRQYIEGHSIPTLRQTFTPTYKCTRTKKKFFHHTPIVWRFHLQVTAIKVVFIV